MSRLLKAYIKEVLTGFGNKSRGKDSGGNLFPMGISVGSASVRKQNGNILDDEESEEQQLAQDSKHAACCLVMSNDGMILGVSRKDDPTAFGMPGGKVDAGETPEQAAARELEEETGLSAKKLSHIFSRLDGHGYVTHTFACEVEGEIDTSESGVVRWVSPEVMLQGPFSSYNKRLFAKVGINSKNK